MSEPVEVANAGVEPLGLAADAAVSADVLASFDDAETPKELTPNTEAAGALLTGDPKLEDPKAGAAKAEGPDAEDPKGEEAKVGFCIAEAREV